MGSRYCLFESVNEEVEIDPVSRQAIKFRPWGIVNEVRTEREGSDRIGVVYRTPLGTLCQEVVSTSEIEVIPSDRDQWGMIFELILWEEYSEEFKGPQKGALIH